MLEMSLVLVMLVLLLLLVTTMIACEVFRELVTFDVPGLLDLNIVTLLLLVQLIVFVVATR